MTSKITVLYDNETLGPGLTPGWGFACLVERGAERVLFDTGWDGDRVLENAAALDVDLASVKTVFISHGHWDHAGGLARLLRVMQRPRVVLPASLSSRLRGEIGLRAELVPVTGPQPVGEGLHSTGELQAADYDLKEQALVIALDVGVALVTGCAHPGLDRLIEAAGAHGPVRAAVGGFHGFDAIEALSPLRWVVPGHCTRHKDAIHARLPDRTVRCGVGLELEL